MKWILKKDLPWAKAGTICEGFYDGFSSFCLMIDGEGNMCFPELTFSDWFEEVDERWKPKYGQDYYFLDTAFCESGDRIACISRQSDTKYDENRFSIHNVFEKKELAERAAEEIKALLKEFHKNNP